MFNRLFRSSPARPPARRRASSTAERCERCGHRTARALPRCPACGARRFAPPDLDRVTELETATAPPGEPREGLSELQRRILAAVVPGAPIFVYRDRGPNEGEVKAGKERFFGDEAILALAALVAPGLVAEAGDDRFELTREGARLARSLR